MTGPTRTYRALLIANSTFPSDAHNLLELEGPRNDPVLLREALCHEEVGLFPTDNVRLVTERTMAEVLGEAEDFLRSATRQDTLLLYYSGHGMLDQSGELFLCTRDSRTDRLRSTAVKATDLRAMMDESAAAATVVVLDCCHSGRFKGGDVPSALSGRGRFVVTSSRSGELANDAHVRNHASLFTHHLAAGMLHGAPDHDRDGIVTLSELYDYVHAALASEGRQVPQKRFEGHGDVAMALRGGSAGKGSESPMGPELVTPAAAAPVLDLSEAAIDLGEVDVDEDLPPERVAIINRGGGTLDWTAESSASWVQVVTDEAAVVLHLHPVPGPNRANVYVRDSHTGALKTLRVTVRVRSERTTGAEAAAPAPKSSATTTTPPPADGPSEATSEATSPSGARPPPPAGEASREEGARHEGDGTRDVPVAFLAVAAASLLAGIVLLLTAADVVDWVHYTSGIDVSLRGKDWGVGLQQGLLSGIALVLVGFLTLAPRLRVPLAACCLGLATPVTFWRLSDVAATQHGCQCVTQEFPWYGPSWVFPIGAAAVAATVLAHTHAWRRTSWAPRPLVGGTVGAALLWGLSLLVDLYEKDGIRYGGAFTDNGTSAGTWRVLAAVSVSALAYCGLRLLGPVAGAALVVGAVVTPLLAVVSEFSYLAAGVEDPSTADNLAVMVIPALVTVGLGVAATVLALRAPEGDRATAE